MSKSRFIINHVGYLPDSCKKLVYTGEADTFTVYRFQDLEMIPVFTGDLIPSKGNDLTKDTKVGDFSDLKEEGVYRIGTSEGNSRCFIIQKDGYDTVSRLLFYYFNWERCGDDLGWNGCCHADDSITLLDGTERTLRGGHHQSSDLRKWAYGTAVGTIGLARFALLEKPLWDHGNIESELRHSMKYFLNLVSDEGYLYDCTWIYEGYHDEFRGRGFHDYSAMWKKKRQFFLSPAPEAAQWYAVSLFALCSRYFAQIVGDTEMANTCLDAAKKVYAYVRNTDMGTYDLPVYPPLGHDGMTRYYMEYYQGSAVHYGAWASAAEDIYRAAADEALREDVRFALRELSKMQLGGDSLCAGCFRESGINKRLANNYYYFFNTTVPQAYLDAIELWSDDEDAGSWKEVAIRIADMMMKACGKNPYGRVPSTWHTVGYDAFDKPGCWSFSSAVEPVHTSGEAGTAQIDGEILPVEYEYENFCYNLDIEATGVFFRRAAKLFGRPEFDIAAQRQLDWLLGANRFDASNIEGVGYNQPHRGIFGEFFPTIPQIPGGVFVGLTDLSFDEKSYGYDNEYDMPMVSWLMHLIALLK